jgi:hypothetical protein
MSNPCPQKNKLQGRYLSVDELYSLREEEIKIVEESVK